MQCFFRHLEPCLADFAASQLSFVPREPLIYDALFLCSCGILFYSCPFSWVLWSGGFWFSCYPCRKSETEKQKTHLPMRYTGMCLLKQSHLRLSPLCSWSCPITLLNDSSEWGMTRMSRAVKMEFADWLRLYREFICCTLIVKAQSIFVSLLNAHYVGKCDHLWIILRLHFFLSINIT